MSGSVFMQRTVLGKSLGWGGSGGGESRPELFIFPQQLPRTGQSDMRATHQIIWHALGRLGGFNEGSVPSSPQGFAAQGR